MQNKYAYITIRENNESKEVRISSDEKPEILPQILYKWQSLIDLTAEIIHVPSGLIMKLNEDNIEVFVKSTTTGNPYHSGEKAELIYGLYCETVIGTQKELHVPDARNSAVWKNNNPDIDLGMVSYLGYPINWPDGEVFGTVCVLDKKENDFSFSYRELLYQLKQHIETDLELIQSNEKLNNTVDELDKMNRIKSKFLSLISHDIRGGMSAINTLIKLAVQNYDQFSEKELLQFLKSLAQNVDATYSTLEELLDWSKNDLMEIKPYKTSINLIAVLEKLIDFFIQSIKLKEIELFKEFCSDKIYIYVDENMLTASLRNILSNAIKYNRKGGRIFVRVKKTDKATIEIEDTGMGMDEKILRNLFNFPGTYHQKEVQSEGSAGIGLTITKDFLDKNNAEITVESTLDEGTKFTITI